MNCNFFHILLLVEVTDALFIRFRGFQFNSEEMIFVCSRTNNFTKDRDSLTFTVAFRNIRRTLINEITWNANLMQQGASHGTIRTVHTTYAAALKTTTHPQTRCRKPYAATQHVMLLMKGECTRNMSS